MVQAGNLGAEQTVRARKSSSLTTMGRREPPPLCPLTQGDRSGDTRRGKGRTLGRGVLPQGPKGIPLASWVKEPGGQWAAEREAPLRACGIHGAPACGSGLVPSVQSRLGTQPLGPLGLRAAE